MELQHLHFGHEKSLLHGLSRVCVSLFYGTECFVALLSGTEQLFNISLHENSSCLEL